MAERLLTCLRCGYQVPGLLNLLTHLRRHEQDELMTARDAQEDRKAAYRAALSDSAASDDSAVLSRLDAALADIRRLNGELDEAVRKLDARPDPAAVRREALSDAMDVLVMNQNQSGYLLLSRMMKSENAR